MNRLHKILICITILFLTNSCSLFEKGELIEPSKFIEIPIVFHVFKNGAPTGSGSNLSGSIINKQLQSLNESFVAANIKFRLASSDPSGNRLSEPGIDRISKIIPPKEDIGFYRVDDKMKDFIWDPNNYLNVFFMELSDYKGGGGATWFPKRLLSHKIPGIDVGRNDNPNSYEKNQAIYINNYVIRKTEEFGYIDQSLIHEIGHYFGLFHIYGADCKGTDYCDDTYHFDYTNVQNGPSLNIDCKTGRLIQWPDNAMGFNQSLNTKKVFTINQSNRMRECISYCYILRNLHKSNK